MHPQRLLGLALYTPVELWPQLGADVWADPCTCAMPDALSGLETLAGCLLEGGLLLEALPLVSVWEHVALHVAGQVQATTLARLARARALVALGLLAEAAVVLERLMSGGGLPHPAAPGMACAAAAADEGAPLQQLQAAPAARFHASQPPGHESNRACLQRISEGVLPMERLAVLYGPWAAAQLVQVRAAFLAAAGAVPYCWDSGRAAATQPAAAAAAGVPGGEALRPHIECVEPGLLSKAAALLQGSIAESRGQLGLLPLPFPAAADAPAGAAKGGGKAAAATQPATGSKGLSRAASVAPPPLVVGGAQGMCGLTAEQRRVLLAQHCHAAVTGLLQLAEVEGQR